MVYDGNRCGGWSGSSDPIGVEDPLEPGGRRPAPEPLRLVQALVNSYDALTDRETLATPEHLVRWMRRHGLDPGTRPIRRSDVARVHRFRESLRAVLAGHDGSAPRPGSIASLNEIAERACLRVAISDDGVPTLLVRDGGVDGAVAAVLRAAVMGGSEARWGRLKACPECGWVFYDHSRNRSGSWCTMAICGSRAKMRAYRRRRSAPGRRPPP